MTRCKNCGDEIVLFSDRWAHYEDGLVRFVCRTTKPEPEEVGFSGGIPHRGVVKVTPVNGHPVFILSKSIAKNGIQVDLGRRRVTVEFAATGVRLLKREEVEGSDRTD